MSDFRKLLLAFAAVTLLAGLCSANNGCPEATSSEDASSTQITQAADSLAPDAVVFTLSDKQANEALLLAIMIENIASVCGCEHQTAGEATIERAVANPPSDLTQVAEQNSYNAQVLFSKARLRA